MLKPDLTGDEIWQLLPTMKPDDIIALPNHPAVKEQHFLKLLERRDLPVEFIRSLARDRRWVKSSRIQFKLVNNSLTPIPDAMNLVKYLFWKDLNFTVQNFRIASEVRHTAEAMLIRRLPAMATGEKVHLARVAAGRVLKLLRTEKEPRVATALLENPRLMEEDVLFTINQKSTPSPVLESVARDAKWSSRRNVRVALLRNPKTPISVSLSFISSLHRGDVAELLKDSKVPLAVKRMIKTRLGGASR